MDLFQQTVLNCHDAIQRHGFHGDRYEFYLLKSLRYLAYREAKVAKRWAPLSDWHQGHGQDAGPAGPHHPRHDRAHPGA